MQKKYIIFIWYVLKPPPSDRKMSKTQGKKKFKINHISNKNHIHLLFIPDIVENSTVQTPHFVVPRQRNNRQLTDPKL